jgi:sensor histidine kinase regulating citrate/malate metabolism
MHGHKIKREPTGQELAQYSVAERSSASPISSIASPSADTREIVGLSEQINHLRQETEQLRQQQHDILQAVNEAPPPMYVEGRSEHDNAH